MSYNPDAFCTHVSLDYYPFGMQMPNRAYSSPDYRYGFNGKEKDDEVKGSGVQIDYGFRIYDARLARFLSVDPLTKDFPMLTPYQYASNTPVQAIDLDGLEGEYYLEVQTDKISGKETIIRAVVEVDIFVMTTSSNPSNLYYSKNGDKSDNKIKKRIEANLDKEFRGGKKGFIDETYNVPLVFKFNVHIVDGDKYNNSDELATELYKSGKYIVTGVDGTIGDKNVILEGADLEALTQGSTSRNASKISNDVSDESHTTAHELSHFMVKRSPEEYLQNMGESEAKHEQAGGIFKYGKALKTENSDDVMFIGTKNLNQENVNQILKSVIFTGKKQVDNDSQNNTDNN